MTECVVFENTGLIDLTAVQTFGVSVKDETRSENPIGYFGTGLKYAIAICLRHKLEFLIQRGMKTYRFGIKHKKVRGTLVPLVTMNDKPLGFTTDVGKNWDLWQAYRELHCNMLDEDGTVQECEQLPKNTPSITRVIVGGKAFVEQFYDRDEIILPEHLCSYDVSSVARVGLKPSGTVFYRGIKVAKHRNQNTLYTYNILKEMTLTEDRTLKYFWYPSAIISEHIQRSNNKDFIYNCLTASKDYWEGEFDYEAGITPSDAFMEVAKEIMANKAIRVQGQILKYLASLLRVDPEDREQLTLNTIQQKQLQRALDFLIKLGYDVTRYDIQFYETLGEGLMGKAMMRTNTIEISKDTFDMGTKYLAATLFEEWFHLSTQLVDETRSMEAKLIDMLLSLGETHLGEPL